MVNFKKLRQMIEVKGNGNLVTREISVSTFIRLHVGCRGVVELHQSDEEKVVVEADENLLEYITAVNAGRTLFVSVTGNVKQPVFTHCRVKIFFRQLNTLLVRNDRGNLVCPQPLTIDQPLDIKIQSSGDTELNVVAPAIKVLCQANGQTVLKGSCGILDIKNQAHGNFDASQLKAGELTIKNMANGNVQLHADGTVKISHYGNGYVHYSGKAVVKDVKQYGNGVIKHVKEEVVI